MRKKISVYPDRLEVTLSLPWDAAEAVVSIGSALLADLSQALEDHRREVESRSRIAGYEDKSAANDVDRWRKLFEETEKLIPRLRAKEGLTETQAISRAADLFHVEKTALRYGLAGYRRRTRAEAKARRDADIIRLFFLGVPEEEIARLVEPKSSGRHVAEVLGRYRDLIRHLEDYRASHDIATEGSSRARSVNPARSAGARSDEAEMSETDAWNNHVARRRAEHARLAIQFYREFRKTKPGKTGRVALCKRLSERHDFGADYVRVLIHRRKRRVQDYIRKRRKKAALSLYKQGRTNTDIARYLRVSSSLARKILQEAKRETTAPKVISRAANLEEQGHV